MKYSEKLEPILNDIENKDIELAGGAIVGIELSTINSLIKYISNLTINKKNYENVQEKVKEILTRAESLKTKSLEIIDKDVETLNNILSSYKTRKENEQKYEETCKKSTEFCMEVLNIANDTLILSDEISKVGNKMLSSDFKICKYYAIASVHSALENIYINLQQVKDEEYKIEISNKCTKILESMNV